jgi:dihydropteroate synthase-like protein
VDNRTGNTLLLTGRLAAGPLRRAADKFNARSAGEGAVLSVLELPISVAALMTPEWILGRLARMDIGSDLSHTGRIVLPGRVSGDLGGMVSSLGVPVARGPEDMRDIPEWLGAERGSDITDPPKKPEIIAEIVDAWRMTPDEILKRAEYFRTSGADCVDLGGNPDEGVPDVEAKIGILKESGFKVSVDTFHAPTIRRACRAGADMILSVNSGNMDSLEDVSCPVVVVPDYELDESEYLGSLASNVESVSKAGLTAIADPILSPPLMDMTSSFIRYSEYRAAYPGVPMLMGTGNVTEMLEADSAGVNALLSVFARELDIDYVLTTEAAAWTRGTVSELRSAGRMIAEAALLGLQPKHISHALRELKGLPPGYETRELREMQASVTDPNWRIFVAGGKICAFNSERFIEGQDVKSIYRDMGISDPAHSFYIGRELQKASIALRLGRGFAQDDDLTWGALP